MYFSCSNNGLSTLKLPDHSDLFAFLYCENNQLDNLDLSGYPNLEILACKGNNIKELDVSKIKRNEYLELTCDDSVTVTGYNK